MKRYFLTGLVILLPVALTLMIVIFFFNLLTDPFVGGFQSILDYFDLLEKGFLFFTPQQLQVGVSKLAIICLLFFFTVGLGALGRWFLVHYFIRLWDYILHRIPIVNTIYKTSQDIVHNVFVAKSKSFKQVVLAPFPHENSYSIGLVTREKVQGIRTDSTAVAVFVPTTPNPTSGFLMMYEEKDLVYIDMAVEDAFKYVISCGVIFSPLKAVTPEEAHEHIRQLEKTAAESQETT